jgi:exodeoxyribonuclease V beta subunit
LEADKIKKTLTAYKIPAVTIDDEKIFNAPESKDILYILEAALEISKANINKALLSKLTGYTIQHILELNEEQVLAQFKSYQETWTTSGKGIYVMLMKFLADHNVRTQLLKKETANGDRIISNVLQLIELLHSTSVKKQLAPIELISWLKNVIEGKSNEGNEFEQRMESDEEAIKIITIHKSKGLEYKILIAPYLDLTSNLSNNITLAEYRNEEDKGYYFVEKNLITEEIEAWRSLQTEQENRRLFYVALTRAKYKCYVIQNNYHKESTLVSFLTALTNTEIDTIDLIEYKAIDSVPVGTYTFVDDKELFPIEFKKTSHFELLQSNWKKMSYSGLNPAHQYKVNFSTNYVTDEYDKFIFKELRKGAQTGNLLHYIFEHIHINDLS